MATGNGSPTGTAPYVVVKVSNAAGDVRVETNFQEAIPTALLLLKGLATILTTPKQQESRLVLPR